MSCMEEQVLISYKGVDINQQELGVLKGVDFELQKGEFVYLIGKVGSGKSTFLKTIYGELEPFLQWLQVQNTVPLLPAFPVYG